MQLTAIQKLGANHIVNEQGETVATVVDQQTAQIMAGRFNAHDELMKWAFDMLETLQDQQHGKSADISQLRARGVNLLSKIEIARQDAKYGRN